MKFTKYPTTVTGRTCYILANKEVNSDLQGGLEEVMDQFVERGVRHIILSLRYLKFLHATLLAGLLSIELKLREVGGQMILVEAPAFVRMMMNQWEVADRFIWVNGDVEGEITNSLENLIDLKNIKLKMDSDIDWQIENIIG